MHDPDAGMMRVMEKKRRTKTNAVTCIFLDIGGVLLTDGWNHHARKRAAAKFKLKWIEMEGRHQLNVSTYEEGKLTLEDYLDRVVFYQVKTHDFLLILEIDNPHKSILNLTEILLTFLSIMNRDCNDNFFDFRGDLF